MTNDNGLTSVTEISVNGVLTSIPAGGSATITMTEGTIVVNSDGSYTFTTATGYSGSVPPISYTATGSAGTDNAKLYIEVAQVYNPSTNNPPVANHDVATTKQGVEVTVKPLLNDSDPDASTTLSVTGIKDGKGNAITATTSATAQTIYNADGTAVGTAYVTGGELKFTPNASYTGDVPFTYGISDGNGGSATSNINVTVLPATATLATIDANDDAKVAPQGENIGGNVLTNDISSVAGLTVTGASVTIGTDVYTLTSGTITIPNVGTITLAANGTYTFDPEPTFTGTVPVEYTISNGTGTDKATLYLTSLPTITKVWTGTNSEDWNTGSNWKSGAVPSDGDNIVFATEGNNGVGGAAKNDLVVPAGETKEIGNLINQSTKATVIPAGSALIVNGTVTGSETNSDKLKIEAKDDGTTANGSIIVKNGCGITVMGTVQMYAKGFKGGKYEWTDLIDGSPTYNTVFSGYYHWQFFGIPVSDITSASPTFDGSFLRKYHEDMNGTTTLANGTTVASYYKKWETLSNSSPLEAFSGYEVTQNAPKIIEMKGALTLCDKTLTLTHKAPKVSNGTTGAGDTNEYNLRYGLGQNIFGNSFTAALPVGNIVFPTDGSVEKTVYLYNTASFGVWGDQAVPGTQTGTNAGMYISIPVETAPVMGYTNIPSMNGFLLRHIGNDDNDRQVTLKYTDLEKNTKPQTAPGKNKVAKEDLSYLEIELNSASTNDKLWMFSQEGTSDNFDNGWDGRKFFGVPTAYIYAPTLDGNMQVSTTSNLIDSYINFIGNNDTQYTLTVKKANLDNSYAELYLVDLVTNNFIPLDKEEVTYKFTASNNGTDVKRFQIKGSANANSENATDMMLNATIVDGKIQLANNSQNIASMQLFDVTGKMIVNKTIQPMTTETLSTKLIKGVYLVKMETGKYQKTVKVVMK